MATEPQGSRRHLSSRIVFGALVAVALVLAGLAGLTIFGTRFMPDGSSLAGSSGIGGPFKLTAADGKPFSSSAFDGKPFAIFFGFTRCPEICPTTLTELSAAMQRLGPDADRMHFAFVSLDPTRDTPEVLGQYVGAFDPRIVGLTGSEADVEKVAKSYKVFWEKVPTSDGDYTLNHSASVYLMDRSGRFTGTIDYQEDMDSVVAKLRRLVGSPSTTS